MEKQNLTNNNDEERINLLQSIGRDVDENGKSYTVFSMNQEEPEDMMNPDPVSGLSHILRYAYGLKGG